MKDFKDTLFMGSTDFSMRANLSQNEPLIEEFWDKNLIYQKVMDKNKDKTPFILHDGPPYANGNIHIGHALNKILKDFIIRYKNMSGFYSPFICGWDTHGLPIENALLKSGYKRDEDPIKFRQACKDYALGQINIQKNGFKRLGIFSDLDKYYKTFCKGFEKRQIEVFSKMALKGLIYKGLKPVYWSYSSQSALAEAEIEYIDKKDKSIYFKFEILDKNFVDCFFLVWTTTPWTLPANLAICLGSDISYSLVDSNFGKIIICTDLIENLSTKIGLIVNSVIKIFKGSDLEYIKYKHPLFNTTHHTILGDHVTTSDGTGLVHTAPGHGEDDFIVCKRYNIDAFCPVDAKGIMTSEAGKYSGMYYYECNEEVIKDLEKNNLLVKVIEIIHSYPHDWRTKKPVIFRATPQWFCSIDKIKDEILDSINNVNWYPSWGNIRISNMIKDRHDWCISRQRLWGVPIPIIYCEDYSPIIDENVFLHIANLIGEYGSSIWFEKEAKDLLPKGYKNDLSPNGIFYKETDIMDVWFDSGSSYNVIKNKGLSFPCDLYLEGSDQFRGWFNSSLITSVACFGTAPYKNVLSHGFTLDGNGRKMSKSLGNVIDPNKVCDTYGADILRLWVLSVNYQQDMPISMDILKQVSESYRKIRNTIRFILSNLSDFNKTNLVSFSNLEEIDKFILIKHSNFKKQILKYYDTFSFFDIYREINLYLSDLSGFYLDFIKDILYIDKPTCKERLSIQSVLYEILFDIITLFAPILPHTMEEAYKSFCGKRKESVFLEEINKSFYEDDEIFDKYSKFIELKSHILKSLEEARNNKIIGKSLESELILNLEQKDYNLVSSIKYDIKKLLIVSKVIINKSNKFEIVVNKAKGCTCPRCWSVFDYDGDLCKRCSEIVEEKIND